MGRTGESPPALHLLTRLLRATSSCRTLRPSVFPEMVAFAQGQKPALRFTVNRRDASHLQSAAADLGLDACVRQVFLVARGNGWHEIVPGPTPRPHYLIAISATGNAVDLANAELGDSAVAGSLLGYPKCCVEAISGIAGASSQWALHLLRGHAAPVDARLNRFAAEWGGIGLLGELFPCSLHCRAAAAYAQSLYDAMTSIGMRKLADAARADALTPVDISPQGRISRATSGGSVEFYW